MPGKNTSGKIPMGSSVPDSGADLNPLHYGIAPARQAAGTADLRGMVWVPGGNFLMGSNNFYPEERPVHQATVEGFWVDVHPVTNAQFREFAEITEYTTVAERLPDSAYYPDADPSLLVPGSLVFRKPPGPVDLRDYRAWWEYVPGADWRHPEGPGSTLQGRDHHPVVHVAHEDAQAYATWAGKELPTEAEWEFAARGGLEGATYVWGDEFMPEGRAMANTWQGQFPWQNLKIDGYEGTSPVGAFPANGYGIHDTAGNVWEWTAESFMRHCAEETGKSCCVPSGSGGSIPRKVVKGGSYLCAPNYCLRYRPAARQGEAIDTSTCHIGFRCVVHASPTV